MLTNPRFLRKAASADTSQLIISFCEPLLVKGVTLDGLERLVQLFHHINIDRFLNLSLECEKCDIRRYSVTPRPTLSTMSN